MRAIQHPVAGTAHWHQPRRAKQPLPQHGPRSEPIVLLAQAVPARKILAVEQRPPTLFYKVRRIAVRIAIIELRPLLGKQTSRDQKDREPNPHRVRVYLSRQISSNRVSEIRRYGEW